MSNRISRSVLSEELRVGKRRVCECGVVVLGLVKVLTAADVSLVVVLSACDVKVSNPSEFTIDVTVFGDFRILGNAGALDFVFIVGVHGFLLSQLTDSSTFSLTVVLVKILLIKVVVFAVVGALSHVMTTVPTSIGKLAIVVVVGNNLFTSHFKSCGITHSAGEVEHSLSIFATER